MEKAILWFGCTGFRVFVLIGYLLHFLILEGGALVILIDYMFLSPFLDVTRTSMSTVSFFSQQDSEILCLQNFFRINRNLLTESSS